MDRRAGGEAGQPGPRVRYRALGDVGRTGALQPRRGRLARTMSAPAFFREVGQGPGVVCLHSNASSSSQWRSLMEALAPKFHVFAVDSYDAGKSPAWNGERT